MGSRRILDGHTICFRLLRVAFNEAKSPLRARDTNPRRASAWIFMWSSSLRADSAFSRLPVSTV